MSDLTEADLTEDDLTEIEKRLTTSRLGMSMARETDRDLLAIKRLLAEVRRLRAERDGDGDVEYGTLWRTQRELDHARNECLRLKGTLRCIEALHHPVGVEPSETICAACSQPRPETDGPYYVEEWPCATIQIINGGDHA